MSAIIASSLISAGASLMNSILGSSSASNLNATNRDFQQQMANTAYARQRELTQDSFQLQKQGLINAGISPAALQGYSGGTASLSSYLKPISDSYSIESLGKQVVSVQRQ